METAAMWNLIDRAERGEATPQEIQVLRRCVSTIVGRAEKAEAAVDRARAFSAEMREYCSPHGISALYADRLDARLKMPEAPAEEPTEDDEGWEFRLSPDRRLFAFYDPGNGPWFVPEASMQGRWVKSADMDRMGWTRFVPVGE